MNMTTTLTTRLYRSSVNATSSFLNNLVSRLKSTGSGLSKKELRALTSLPSDLSEAIIGMLLGDAGCFRISKSPTSNSRLEFSFGKDRFLFAKFIEGLLRDYVTTPVSSRLVHGTPGGPNIHTSYRLKTIALPVFNFYRDLFYKYDPITGKFVKIVPKTIIEYLSPIALAHLVMGDGNFYAASKTIRIYTNGFTHDDVVLLANAIRSKFDINVGVRHDRKNQYILAIGAKELTKFQELVREHMHDSMLYRIGL